MTEREIKVFRRFLKETGIYSKFMFYTFSPKTNKCNCYKQIGRKFKRYLNLVSYNRVLIDLFIWGDAYHFWLGNSIAWNKYYDSE